MKFGKFLRGMCTPAYLLKKALHIIMYILLRIDYDRHISFHFGGAVLGTLIFSSHLRVQTGPGVHAASYKMSSLLGAFPGSKGGRAKDYLVLVPCLCICGTLHPHPPWTFMVCNGDIFTFRVNFGNFVIVTQLFIYYWAREGPICNSTHARIKWILLSLSNI